MTYDESEDMSFWLSQVESLVKGFVSKGDLEKSMNSLKGYLRTLEEMMENKMENTMGHMEDSIVERIVKLLQNTKEKIPKGDDVDQGAHDDMNSAHVEKPSINKHALRGFGSNIESNQGWCIQLPNIDMRKFDGKDPITWIFQMEQFFDIHHVPNLQKVVIASLYLEPQ